MYCLSELMQYLAKQDARKLFTVLNKLPGFGVGRRVAKVTWKLDEKHPPCYWTITRVVPNEDLKGGEAWGKLKWRGYDEGPEKRISNDIKRVWKLFPKE